MIKNYLIAIMLFAFSLSSYAQVDSLILNNGDVIVGELKDMDKGVLTIETDYSDSDFKIEWDKVKYLKTESKYFMNISKKDMSTFSFGKTDGPTSINSNIVSDPDNPNNVIVQTDEGPISISSESLVYIKSYNNGFFSKLSATIDIGMSMAKAKNLKQLNVRSNVSYLSDNWGANGNLDVTDSRQDSIEDIHRLDAEIGFNYFLPRNFIIAVSTSFAENDELNLDLRTTYKGGFGYFLLRTNKLYWRLGTGFAYNNEVYFTGLATEVDPNPRRSEEIYYGIEINLFDIGDLNILSSINAYSSLSEDGRFRYDFKFDLKYDLPFDLYVKAGTTINYDNRPVAGADIYDYVINTGIGWEFN